MCKRSDSTTTKLEPAGEHGVLHAFSAAHDDTPFHDAAHDTAAHDTATAATATSATTPVLQHDNADSIIHGRPESTLQ